MRSPIHPSFFALRPLGRRVAVLALSCAPLLAAQGPPSGGPRDAPPGGPADGPPPDGPPPMEIMSAAEEEAERGLRLRSPGAFAGLTLLAPLNSRSVYLVDLDGEVVHTWETASSPGHQYLLDDGTLLRCGRKDEDPHFRGGGIGGFVERLAPDGRVLWRMTLADEERHQHHDVEPLPNGNLLLIAWERVSHPQAIALGRAPKEVGEEGFWPDVVLEVRPTGSEGGEIVWEWHALDHVVQDVLVEAPHFGDVTEHPERIDLNGDHRDRPPMSPEQRKQQEELEKRMAAIGYAGGDEEEDDEADRDGSDADAPPPRKKSGDWLHTNAVAYSPELDLIALSSPHLNEVFVIDHSTTTAEAASSRGGRYGRGGDLLWRWGNPRNYGAGDDGDRRLYYQHDPTWVTGADGGVRLLLFNNGRGREDGDYSSVEELVLPFDPEHGFALGDSGAFGPDEPAWTYADPTGFYSAFISGAQRLPNGNTLICSGTAGRVFEVTPQGEVVWDFFSPFGGDVDPPEHAGKAPPLALFRAERLALEHPGVRALLAEKQAVEARLGSLTELVFRDDRAIDAEAFAGLLRRSGLAPRRPADDPECLAAMLAHADLLVTAWEGETLVGVARSVTDFAYCCYLSDLAVDERLQRRGIGRELLRRTQARLGPRCRLILLAAPAAAAYYPRVGFERHESAWILADPTALRAGGTEPGISPPGDA